jgi:hypothetical protein
LQGLNFSLKKLAKFKNETKEIATEQKAKGINSKKSAN